MMDWLVKLIELVLSGFWPWLGFCFIGGAIIDVAAKCWSRFLRHLNVRKHGWPPSHLDADGDWKNEEQAVNEDGEVFMGRISLSSKECAAIKDAINVQIENCHEMKLDQNSEPVTTYKQIKSKFRSLPASHGGSL